MSGGTKDVLRHLESVSVKHKKELRTSEDQRSIINFNFKCGVTSSEKMSNSNEKSFSTSGAEQ